MTNPSEMKKLLADWQKHQKDAQWPNKFIESLLAAQEVVSRFEEQRMVDNEISKLLHKNANTPLAERKNGWNTLLELRKILAQRNVPDNQKE